MFQHASFDYQRVPLASLYHSIPPSGHPVNHNLHHPSMEEMHQDTMHPMQGAVRLLHSYCLTRRCPVPSALKNTTFSVLTSLFKKCQTNLINPT